MNLTAEQIQENWVEFNNNISTYITGDRKQKLLNFYTKYEDRIILMPAANNIKYHSAFPGGYIDHVNRVVRGALAISNVWESFGCNMTSFTQEELIFSAINHDLGKMGSDTEDAYITQTDNWRRDKMGETYAFNASLPFASVPDRSLFLLQQHDIKYTFNEMVAIQTHDGLYDEANGKYLKSFMPETKPRTALPFILHQADLMAARIEFEIEWLPKLSKNNVDVSKSNHILPINKKTNTKSKALNNISSLGLRNMLDNL